MNFDIKRLYIRILKFNQKVYSQEGNNVWILDGGRFIVYRYNVEGRGINIIKRVK